MGKGRIGGGEGPLSWVRGGEDGEREREDGEKGRVVHPFFEAKIENGN